MTQMTADNMHGICANLRNLRLTQEPVHRARQAPESSKQVSANHLAMNRHAVIFSKAACQVCLSSHVGVDSGNDCIDRAPPTRLPFRNGPSGASVNILFCQFFGRPMYTAPCDDVETLHFLRPSRSRTKPLSEIRESATSRSMSVSSFSR